MLTLEIITPERSFPFEEGDEVLIPTTSGIIGVRQGHLPLITILQPGEISVRHDNGKADEFFAVSGGYAEILPDRVLILADSVERSEELNELKIKEAIQRALDIKEQAKDKAELDTAAAALEVQLARMKVFERSHKRH